ncbi:hypothetical protein XELAEV_18026849mg [Xenopus laevis]|uniref:Uncharacterized protein n=1 Tax=Xenopus laevis TaxID=8355 RepID=A0A974CWC3_XENLA|nr:hypothetical protein XELAEV_18026849mg [Xenopus laevis]
MTILPRILYLFRVLPVYLSEKMANSLQKAITQFIWDNKSRLSEIVAMHRTPTMPWLDVKNAGLAPLALNQIIWIPEKDRKIPDQLPPTTIHSLQIWDKYREKLHLSQRNTIYCTFLGNKKFPPVLEIRDFLPWTENNAYLCTTLVKGREIRTFQDLKDSLQIPNSQLFRFLKIRHFISHTFLHGNAQPLAPSQSTHLISRLYNRLSEDNTTLAQKYMAKWVEVKQETIENEKWQTIWEKARCGERGTFYHMWWTCEIVKAFWRMVAHTLSSIFKQQIEPEPLSFLLGLPLKTLKTSASNKLATHIITAAKTLRAAKWKSASLPTNKLSSPKLNG